jgi:hypothetical protein
VFSVNDNINDNIRFCKKQIVLSCLFVLFSSERLNMPCHSIPPAPRVPLRPTHPADGQNVSPIGRLGEAMVVARSSGHAIFSFHLAREGRRRANESACSSAEH